jgi:hypothetical protein
MGLLAVEEVGHIHDVEGLSTKLMDIRIPADREICS